MKVTQKTKVKRKKTSDLQSSSNASLLSGFSWKRLLPVALIVVAMYGIVPQLHIFKAGLHSLHNVQALPISVAVVAIGFTFVWSALTFCTLAFHRLSFRRMLIIELAANFINRILPAGVGGIGANYRYLRSTKHSAGEAAGVVAVNNSLGLLGHATLVVVLSLVFHSHLPAIHIPYLFKIIAALVITIVVVSCIFWTKLRSHIVSGIKTFAMQLVSYSQRPGSVAQALALQICLTLTNVLAFWLCLLALHLHVSYVSALLVFTFGFGVGIAVPLPGGLGGVEAGLAAGLVAYHIAAPEALAAVIVYRLISYWLPLIISGFVLLYASRRHYFSSGY